jgi:glucans biosynthesis protein
MHGGAAGSGAPYGNTNALKGGLHTRSAIDEGRRLRDLIRRSLRLVREIG